MKFTPSQIFSRLYVGFYVIIGYCGYFLRSIGPKSIVGGISALALLLGVVFTLDTDPSLSGNDALNKGYDHQNSGNINDAHSSFELALDFYEEKQDRRAMLHTLRLLGDSDLSLNKHDAALYHYEGALRLAQQLDFKKSQINLLAKHGDVKLRIGRVNAARAHYYDAVKISQDINSFDDTGALFTKVGNLERDIGNDRRARFAYRSAMENYADHSNTLGKATLH